MALPKSTRLKSSNSINALFDKPSKSVRTKTLKLIYLWKEREDTGPEILFTVSVPKKKLKMAVDRNLIKRRITEAYRLNQEALNNPYKQKQLHLMVIYLAHQKVNLPIMDYKAIAIDVISLLKRVK